MKFMSLCLGVAVRAMGKFMAISLDAYGYWAPQD